MQNSRATDRTDLRQCILFIKYTETWLQMLHVAPPSQPHPHYIAFSAFQLPSVTDISDLICKSKPSTRQLYPLPTVLVKACLPPLLPLISAIIHSSLTTGTVPASFKVAAIAPILKKKKQV